MTDKKQMKCETCGYVQDVTGFGEVMPPCPECGDTSSWARVNIPPVEMTKEEAEAVDRATAQAKETGFEDIMPPAPEAGDVSSIARNSILPVKDEPVQSKQKQYRCENCGSEHQFDASIVVLPACPECDDEGSWVAINVTEFLTGEKSQLECDEEKPEPNKETGFEDIVPAAPESGDMSTVALNSIKPVDVADAPKRESGEPNKETGFEDIVPAAPESGDMSTIALGSIKPVKDEPVAKREKQEYKCEQCGESITAYGDALPPCPECGDIGSWTLANLGVRR